jgi:hypothetical protein
MGDGGETPPSQPARTPAFHPHMHHFVLAWAGGTLASRRLARRRLAASGIARNQLAPSSTMSLVWMKCVSTMRVPPADHS